MLLEANLSLTSNGMKMAMMVTENNGDVNDDACDNGKHYQQQ